MYKSVVVLLGCLFALASAMPAADTDLQTSVSSCDVAKITEDIVAVVVKSLDVVVTVVQDSTKVIDEISTCAAGQKALKVIECIIKSLTGEGEAVKEIVADVKTYVDYIKTSVPEISAEIKACKKASLLLDFIGEEEF